MLAALVLQPVVLQALSIAATLDELMLQPDALQPFSTSAIFAELTALPEVLQAFAAAPRRQRSRCILCRPAAQTCLNGRYRVSGGLAGFQNVRGADGGTIIRRGVRDRCNRNHDREGECDAEHHIPFSG